MTRRSRRRLPAWIRLPRQWRQPNRRWIPEAEARMGPETAADSRANTTEAARRTLHNTLLLRSKRRKESQPPAARVHAFPAATRSIPADAEGSTTNSRSSSCRSTTTATAPSGSKHRHRAVPSTSRNDAHDPEGATSQSPAEENLQRSTLSSDTTTGNARIP